MAGLAATTEEMSGDARESSMELRWKEAGAAVAEIVAPNVRQAATVRSERSAGAY